MAKKVSAQRLEARKLYEQDGLSLTEIADKLDKSINTLKTWRRRDQWIKCDKPKDSDKKKPKEDTDGFSKPGSKKRKVNPNKHPNFEPGNQEAKKHGLYTDRTKDERFLQTIKESAEYPPLEILRETIDELRTNIVLAQDDISKDRGASLKGLSSITTALTNSVVKYEDLVDKAVYRALREEELRSKQIDNDRKQIELNREIAIEEGKSSLNYKGLPIDDMAPVFAPLHYDIASNKYREFVLPGGRGSTKSSFISLEIIDLIEKNPNYHALVCRQIDKDLRDSVFNQLIWAITKLGLDPDYEWTLKPLEITKKSTNQKIYFTGLKDPTSVKSFTPRFGYVAILWFEELDQILGDETVRKVQQSIVRGGDTFYIFKSFNPPRSKNNWANMYIQEPKESMNVYFSTYLDVPESWLGEPFIEEAKFLEKVNPEAYKNEYLGEANGSGGNVFPNLVTREITDEEISHFDNIVNGLDFGWVHPSFFIRAQYNVAQQEIIIFDEICKSYIPNEKLAKEIKEHGIGANDPIVCDSAEPKSIRNLQDQGLRAVPAKKGPGSVDYGVKWLASQIRIVVDPKRTPMFYKQAINYEYERDKEGNITSLLPSINDDGIAALRYALERFFTRRRSGAIAL